VGEATEIPPAGSDPLPEIRQPGQAGHVLVFPVKLISFGTPVLIPVARFGGTKPIRAAFNLSNSIGRHQESYLAMQGVASLVNVWTWGDCAASRLVGPIICFVRRTDARPTELAALRPTG
jgi:hypothetical protein